MNNLAQPGQSVSFDRAASYYDHTRTEPLVVAAALTEALIEHGQPTEKTRAVEVGVCTGRISIPLLRRGIPLIGVDMSLPMMSVMRDKHPASVLAQADATQLPFATDSVDTLIFVHVLHLIGGWERALLEVQRLLRAEGKLLNCWQEHDSESAGQSIIKTFFEMVQAHGGSSDRPGVQNRETLLDFWHMQGWQNQTYEIADWTSSEPLSMLVERIRDRQWSSTWQIADDVFKEVLREWTDWLNEEYRDQNPFLPQQRRIMLDVVTPSSQRSRDWLPRP